MTDTGLKELSGLENLSALNLGLCKEITGVGFGALKPLRNLTGLTLQATSVNDAGLKELASIKSLTRLNLTACHQITDAGLEELAALSNLSQLSLRGCRQITESGPDVLRRALPNVTISR